VNSEKGRKENNGPEKTISTRRRERISSGNIPHHTARRKTMKLSLKKWITWYLVAALLVIGITPRVYAGFSPSEGFALASGERTSNLDKVQKFLEMKMVRERLKDLGFTPEEIQGKLNDLSDQQLHQLAMKMDDLKVGGGDALGVIIAILVIIILVIIIIQLTGHKIVIK